jgi:hypothetical protein
MRYSPPPAEDVEGDDFEALRSISPNFIEAEDFAWSIDLPRTAQWVELRQGPHHCSLGRFKKVARSADFTLSHSERLSRTTSSAISTPADPLDQSLR